MESFKRKSIKELINGKYQFYIPAYQRGYKWTPNEVQKLMNDIWEFHSKPNSTEPDTFYCLQPVVVKPAHAKTDTVYHVIDGQQRLTTILILQQAINDYDAFKDNEDAVKDDEVDYELRRRTLGSKTFSITYETRGASSNWLSKRYDSDSMAINSDYHHIFNAYRTALEFLASIDDTADENELVRWITLKNGGKKLLEEIEEARVPKRKESEACRSFSACMKDKCDVIWYELEESDETDEDVFDRLNTGKISLNNAELIKALFLQKDNYPVLDGSEVQSEDYRTSIAREWDSFEHQLQNPCFWYFIYDEKSVGMSYDTRIEFILDLVSGKTKKQSDNYYFTFDYYDSLYKKYKNGEKGAIGFVNEQWMVIRELMQTLQDWYDNKTFYHYIGYLLSQGYSVNEIKDYQFPKDADGNALPIPAKDEFIHKLEELIRSQIQCYGWKDLYKSGKGLTPVLLLFNVLSELSSPNDNARYPFHYYKQIDWNEEHVAPATEFEPNNPARCFQFAAEMLEYYTDISYFAQLDDVTKKESMKPSSQRRKPGKIKDEVWQSLVTEYAACLDTLDEDKEICKKLYEVFKAKGRGVEELSKECYAIISAQFDTSTNHLEASDSTERDFIWNQVLLDEGTNKSYGNAIFPYKRKRIIKNSSRGLYVPLGTHNVFVKAYSYQMQNMFEWDRTDATRYLAEIIRVLNDKGRNFFDTKKLLSAENAPEFIDVNVIKQYCGYDN